MSNIDDHLRKATLRIEQHKNQKSLHQRKEQEARRKLDTRRYIIIGELVCKHFPEMMNCQPQMKKSETAKEFSDFEETLRLLASNRGLLIKLKSEVGK